MRHKIGIAVVAISTVDNSVEDIPLPTSELHSGELVEHQDFRPRDAVYDVLIVLLATSHLVLEGVQKIEPVCEHSMRVVVCDEAM